MAIQFMPQAKLEPRRSDVALTNDQLLRLSLFSQLKRKPSLDKFPGALVVRYYRENEMIFRQGEAGWTAFYVLTTEDVLFLRLCQLAATWEDEERRLYQEDIDHLTERAALLARLAPDDKARTLATIYFAVSLKGEGRKRAMGKMFRFKNDPFEGPLHNQAGKTFYVPELGPETLSYNSFKAPLREGELFGEMSCLYRTPRSATVVARQDFYVVEMLRNIFEQIRRDAAYKAQSDETSKKRVLDLNLRELPIFRDLCDEEHRQLSAEVELVSFEPGQLIYDEHERSDCAYVVLRGMVKVAKGISWLLDDSDVTEWRGFIAQLLRGVDDATSAERTIWFLLSQSARRLFESSKDLKNLPKSTERELLDGLNDVITSRRMIDVKAFQSIFESSEFQEQISELPDNPRRWSDSQARRHNRLLLELIFPRYVRQRHKATALEQILAYCATGELFGEMGLMQSEHRIASCVAHGHPNDYGQVELVRIPEAVFWKILDSSPKIRTDIEQRLQERRKQVRKRLAVPVWDDVNQLQFTDRFEELGLIQGQQLMLIDLDRCTRCDECVQACVNVHPDGRNRLFLDGPRFDKYLVPTTCRSCIDPVCLIGCPVGSIHRGGTGEIIIEDWCIGCCACADACPYGSIQMHDLGIVPAESRGWQYLPECRIDGDGWQQPKYRSKKWLSGRAPFLFDRETADLLHHHATQTRRDVGSLPICFRHEFALTPDQVRDDLQYKIEILAQGNPEGVKAWLNGHELERTDKLKKNRHEFMIPPKVTLDLMESRDGEMQWNLSHVEGTPLRVTEVFRVGANVIAAQVPPPKQLHETLFQLRLDVVRKPKNLPANLDERVAEEVTEKVVTHRAVVCDTCSSLAGGKPACVQACPHDAALRVNARDYYSRE